jgi:ornithine cyclodeaminase
MQFIPKEDVERLAPYGPLVEALAKGLREPIESPPRSHFNPNHDASTVLIMPAWKPHQVMGTKIVSIWPENNARGQSAVSAIYVVTSCKDGTPLAVIDGTELTLRRTAAAAALAARLLARPMSTRLLVVGSGALSAHMAMAHHSVFSLSAITIWGRHLDKAQSVVATLARAGITARATDDLQQALANTDIVAAATTASTAFIPSEWVHAGTHLGLIGAFTASMAEAELQLLPRARLFADNRAAVLEKGGEVVQALRAGLISEQDVLAELSELVALPSLVDGRRSEADITVFKSVGFAALDLIAAEHVLAGLAG